MSEEDIKLRYINLATPIAIVEAKDGKQNYKELFKPEFFDLVIVDECHRGSAKDDSNWREILEYFSGAIQIGMTATPKETRYQSNITYFGEPPFRDSANIGD